MHLDDGKTMTYVCAYCGEQNEIFVDPSGGYKQSYTEDCAVCCRPNVIHIIIYPNGTVTLTSEFEG